ncbi:ATPase [Paramicrobacterium fandaimingii]|uniref:ATPase n=1 Tax=Paramicrobacterium fandaimingii TaxID=2708079 RepID=UPI00141E1A71|nr:ATPase [Microbacterium fandaimingii]
MEDIDTIERHIDIDATAARVWELISEPGWYVNDGELRDHRRENRGDVTVVHDSVHGEFAFVTVELDEPRYAAFRWLQQADDPASASTLVEFRIVERPSGGVTLSVTESGFASLPGSAADRRKAFDGNLEGWIEELEVAKAHCESSPQVRP